MRVREHLLLSTAAAAVAAPWLKKDTWIPFASSILIDVDHYLWYVISHRTLSLRDALTFFNQADPPQTASMKFMHQPLFLGLLLFLAARFRSRLLFLILAGLLFHVSLDAIHITQMSRLKRTLSEEAASVCGECNRFVDELQLHTHTVTNNLLDRYNPKHFVVLCPECHELAHQK
ncbi:hypothetical protein KSF_023300 [Reticulibacter mediterranei]|uniref:Uncharacterized protein n=1 Tax=Reticulibacter mediterranei TaxID=2778369 RepID=A0A8J3N2J4_9CHLR|nr:hypothetical protein [Reticulibacter mediterranei]GHO92282.1 hypothetical protein KSF_023300 [Reticulibacter mediterranei]